MAHIQFNDELIKEYLLFRGFSATLKSFDNEIKIDKEKGFRIDRVVDGLIQSVHSYDLNALRDTWSHLETRLFGRLDQNFAVAIKKLETALLKFYLVHCAEKNNNDKVTDFFVKMTPELSGQVEWREWFTFPFTKNPEESSTFAVYFTRQWQESLFVSLHNFLAAVYQNLPLPTLAAFEDASLKATNLQKENEMLRRGIANLLPSSNDPHKIIEFKDDLSNIKDDFHDICQEVKTADSQGKTIRSFMKRGTTLSVSPLASTSSGAIKKQTTKRIHVEKRSSSTEARAGPSRSRDRDSSLDPATAGGKFDRQCVRSEGSFILLSQDEYSEHKSEIIRLKLNGRGNVVASLDCDGNVRVWSTPPACRTVAVFYTGPQARILEWVLHHERYLLCADHSGRVRLLDVKETQLVWELTLSIDADARLVDVVSSPVESSALILIDGKLSVLDLKTKKVEKPLEIASRVKCAVFTSNGLLTVCGCDDGSVIVFDIKKNEVSETLAPLASQIVQLQLSVDNHWCFYISDNKEVRRVPLHSKESQSISFTADVLPTSPGSKSFLVDETGACLLSSETSSGVIFKVSDQGLEKCLELGGHKANITCFDWCFANQCATCVTASCDGKIRISTLLVDTTAI